MHVGYITPEYPTSLFAGNIGGIATFIKSIGLQLIAKNHSVTVFVYSQGFNKVITEEGIRIHFIKLKKVTGLTWFTNRRFVNAYINKIAAQDKIDVLEAAEWTGFTAFMKFSRPLIIRLHGSDTYFCNLESRKVKYKNRFFEKRGLLGADVIVGVSKFVSQQTKELFGLKREIKTVYNAIDTKEFLPNHENVQPKTILYFGSIIRKKGVLEIAKVFNKIAESDDSYKLYFLGRDTTDVFTGSSTLQLCKELLTPEAEQNFEHLEAMPYEQVKKVIQQMEVVVLPSFAEAFPMTWLEAMSMEKKLITSNIGWANELMIDGETGYTVNPKHTQEFSSKLLYLFENQVPANKMAQNARQRIINTFDIQNNLNDNINLYKTTIR